jgi:hypothetical protein
LISIIWDYTYRHFLLHLNKVYFTFIYDVGQVLRLGIFFKKKSELTLVDHVALAFRHNISRDVIDTSFMSAACSLTPGDTTWMVVASVLVLNMMPALALFEAGLLRAKHFLSIGMQVCCHARLLHISSNRFTVYVCLLSPPPQVFAGVVVLCFMWQLFGYSLVFGPDHGGFIGSFQYALLIGVSYDTCSPRTSTRLSCRMCPLLACIHCFDGVPPLSHALVRVFFHCIRRAVHPRGRVCHFSNDVCCHHASAADGSRGGTHEVQGLPPLCRLVGIFCVLPLGP